MMRRLGLGRSQILRLGLRRKAWHELAHPGGKCYRALSGERIAAAAHSEEAVPKDRCQNLPFTLSAADSKWIDTPFAQRVFDSLKLTNFTDEELRSAFEAADHNKSGVIEKEDLRKVVRDAHVGRVCETQIEERSKVMAAAMMDRLDRNNDERITWDEFRESIVELAQQRDPRVWPVAASMLGAGIAVGVVLPAMPMMVQQLSLSQAEFGYVVSAFGFSKLLANIPAGVYVDSQGRRPAMVGGLLVAGVGMAGIGLASSLEHLILARFTTGVGASFMMAGSTMVVADISTPLNRARMLAPMMTAFSAGTVLGPALGGSLISTFGLSPTLFMVGAIFCVNAVVTRVLTSETMPPRADAASYSISEATQQTLRQWRPLWGNSDLRAALGVNGAYWVALSGGNMTLTPLMLAGRFGLSPAEIGTTFALQAAISVLGAPPAAWLADRFGPSRLLAPGLSCVAVSMMVLPLCPDMYWAAMPLAVNAIGSTMLSSAPTAMTANLVSSDNRTQAIAMMRTMGDVGWLFGGMSVGVAATYIGNDLAMQGTAVCLLAVAASFALRRTTTM